jgi:hypothetical protein
MSLKAAEIPIKIVEIYVNTIQGKALAGFGDLPLFQEAV